MTEADAAELYRTVTESLDHLRAWMPWAVGYDESKLAEFLADAASGWDRGTQFAHVITVDDAIVGVVTANRAREHDLVEIGYWLHPAHTGRGHVTTAVAELVEFAFALDGVDRIQIWHDEANLASRGVPRRLGFTEIDRRTPPREPAIGNRVGVDVVWELRR